MPVHVYHPVFGFILIKGIISKMSCDMWRKQELKKHLLNFEYFSRKSKRYGEYKSFAL